MDETVQLGPFLLGDVIGTGGMGTVYRAAHRDTDVSVAIKVIRSQRDRDARRQFHEEVQAHAGLIHPGIAYLFEYGEVGAQAASASGGELREGSRFVAMELAGGGTVRDAMPLWNWSSVRRLLVQILDALAYAHARGVVHRDLKPENFLVFEEVTAFAADRRVKLADFGIAHAFGAEHEADTEWLSSAKGTPLYMAPEQLRGNWRSYGPWTDLYALGCITWELVCGRPPFEGDNAIQIAAQHDRAERPALEAQFPVPDRLAGWTRRAMAKDPKARFRRAAEALRTLPGEIERDDSAPSADEQRSGDGGEAGADVETAETTEMGSVGRSPTLTSTVRTGGASDSHPDMYGDTREFEGGDRSDAPSETGRAPAVVGRVPERWNDDDRESLPAPLVGTGLGLFGLREPPFVDRDPERDAIWRKLREAWNSKEPRVVLVVGDSGTGKSRLVEWMATRAHELGAAEQMRAVHTPGGESAGEGVGGMVRRAVRGQKLERGEFYEHLLEALPPLDDDRADFEADARALTELVIPTSEEAESVDGPRYRFSNPGQKSALLTRFMRRSVRGRPLFVWLDDLQWGDRAISFLSHLLESRFERPPALVAATVRGDVLAEEPAVRERIEALESHEHCLRLHLETLGARDHRDFVGRLLPLDDQLGDRIAGRTEGNPLFATQLLGHLVDEGRLEAGPEGFRLAEGAELDVPADIHELWRRRIGRLVDAFPEQTPEEIWRALEVAAALGREVSEGEWRSVAPDLEPEVLGRLREELLERGLAERTDDGWDFTHGLLVDSLERHARSCGRWSGQHRRCAEMLDATYPSRAEWTASRRADHWIEAGELERALEPLLVEAERQLHAGHLTRMEEVLERRADVLESLGLPEDDPRPTENRIKLEQCRCDRGDAPEPIRDRVERERGRAEAGGWNDLAAEAGRVAGICSLNLAEFERGSEDLGEAVDHARASGDRELTARTLLALGWVEQQRGALDRAEDHLEEGGELAAEAGSRYWSAISRHALGWVALSRGGRDRARELFERVREQSREAGFRWLEANCLNGLGEVARFDRDADRARSCYLRYRQLTRELNRPWDVANSYLNLGQVELLAGRFDEAARQLDVAERQFERIDQKDEQIHFLRLSRLARAAGVCNRSEFDRIWEMYAEGWPEDRRLIQDHPWLLEMAGAYAVDADWPDRARDAWGLARDLQEELDNEEAVERLRNRLSALN